MTIPGSLQILIYVYLYLVSLKMDFLFILTVCRVASQVCQIILGQRIRLTMAGDQGKHAGAGVGEERKRCNSPYLSAGAQPDFPTFVHLHQTPACLSYLLPYSAGFLKLCVSPVRRKVVTPLLSLSAIISSLFYGFPGVLILLSLPFNQLSNSVHKQTRYVLRLSVSLPFNIVHFYIMAPAKRTLEALDLFISADTIQVQNIVDNFVDSEGFIVSSYHMEPNQLIAVSTRKKTISAPGRKAELPPVPSKPVFGASLESLTVFPGSSAVLANQDRRALSTSGRTEGQQQIVGLNVSPDLLGRGLASC